MSNFHHPVEGEWNNFIFEIIQKEDIEEVLENFRLVFCKDGPIAKLTRASENPGSLKGMITYVKFILMKDEGLSFVARNKVTRKIAGLRITTIVRSSDHDVVRSDEVRRSDEAKRSDVAIVTQLIRQNLDEINEEANVFEKYGVNECADLAYTSVNSEYRGQGLATEIYRRTLALLRAREIPLCKSIFVSPAAHKVGIRFGFEELVRRRFLDFNDGKGNQILPTASPDQVAILMVVSRGIQFVWFKVSHCEDAEKINRFHYLSKGTYTLLFNRGKSASLNLS